MLTRQSGHRRRPRDPIRACGNHCPRCAQQHARIDPDRAAVEERIATTAQDALHGFNNELDEMRMDGSHPDAVVANITDSQLLRLAYAREAEVLRQLEVATAAERALETQPERAAEELGVAPEPEAP